MDNAIRSLRKSNFSAISVANVDKIALRKTAKKSLKTMSEKIDLESRFHIRREDMSSLYIERGLYKSHYSIQPVVSPELEGHSLFKTA